MWNPLKAGFGAKYEIATHSTTLRVNYRASQ
jgi:hypothetical protein